MNQDQQLREALFKASTEHAYLLEKFGRDNVITKEIADVSKVLSALTATIAALLEASAQREQPAAKPAECENGCPKNQVCDYCQGSLGVDKPAASKPEPKRSDQNGSDGRAAAKVYPQVLTYSPARVAADLIASARTGV